MLTSGDVIELDADARRRHLDGPGRVGLHLLTDDLLDPSPAGHRPRHDQASFSTAAAAAPRSVGNHPRGTEDLRTPRLAATWDVPA